MRNHENASALLLLLKAVLTVIFVQILCCGQCSSWLAATTTILAIILATIYGPDWIRDPPMALFTALAMSIIQKRIDQTTKTPANLLESRKKENEEDEEDSSP